MNCVQNASTSGTCAQVAFDQATNRVTLYGTGTPTYDSDGSMTNDGSGNTYSYDGEGRLAGETLNNVHGSATFVYNAVGQLVEDNESSLKWENLHDRDVLYDAFGRRIGDYANDMGQWDKEYFPYDGPVAVYNGSPAGAPWTVFRNRLGSTRWDVIDGHLSNADSLYDPHGNVWYDCTIYGAHTSTFALFDPYCVCLPTSIGPGSRPYNPTLGRWMSTRPYWFQDPSNPMGFGGYDYAQNDPINNVDSGTGNPTKPPLPGMDQRLNERFNEAQKGAEQLVAIDEALDPIEARVVPAAGMMTAGAGVAGVAAYATAVAPWASPVTVPVGAAGAAMAIEGADYLVTGQLSLANWAASHF